MESSKIKYYLDKEKLFNELIYTLNNWQTEMIEMTDEELERFHQMTLKNEEEATIISKKVF